MPIKKFLSDVDRQFATGIAREHAYRPALKVMIEELCPEIIATNDPARIECGAPDFILSKDGINRGFIEAKDIGLSLDSIEDDAQLRRYRESLDNLILTDYLEYRFFNHGDKTEVIRIAKVDGNRIKTIPESFDRFHDLIVDFCAFSGQTITEPLKLAKMMATKSRLMAGVLQKAIEDDIAEEVNTELYQQLQAFRTVLIHDLEPKDFAGIYSQTIAYGMFAARYHDRSLATFSRQEAASLIPKSNPFLRKLFQNIAGPDLDTRIDWIVEALVDIFRATDVAKLLEGFGALTGKTDPFIHFYETFLAEFDAKLRHSKGVWFTPEPVVDFIVRSIDEILVKDFAFEKGMADTSRTKIRVENFREDKRTKTGRAYEEHEVHRIQILDPATGTGTFLASVIKKIYEKFRGQEGMWPSYVLSDLIPRIYGFEILMAPYAVAHLKLEMLLEEMGYNADADERLRVYLTDSLEEHHPDTGTLFSTWLSTEAAEANLIKRDQPIMVVLGNPPYSLSDSNRGAWIERLVADYKVGVGETNINALSYDYVKFIRCSEFYVERTGSGIVGLITNNSFLDGLSHKTMRRHLMETFDSIHVVNLHGDAKDGSGSANGDRDENVFDIQQGVCISVFLKSEQKKDGLADVSYMEVKGSRAKKYEMLESSSIEKLDFEAVEPRAPDYFFYPRNYDRKSEYDSHFSVKELFPVCSSGIKFRKDSLFIKNFFEPSQTLDMLRDVSEGDEEFVREKYDLKDTEDWVLEEKKKYFRVDDSENVRPVLYKPFDIRYGYYPPDRVRELIPRGDHRINLIRHFLEGPNIGLIINRQHVGEQFSHALLTNVMCSHGTFYLGNRGQDYLAPLYVYESDLIGERRPNLDHTIYEEISQSIENLTPESLLDYIYAVLYSTEYRHRYAEDLKKEFPRIPYPSDQRVFDILTGHGANLRQLHLMGEVGSYDIATSYPVAGDHMVSTPRYEAQKVFINKTQYFGSVPENAWELMIGGYKPAQKWLKDRRGRCLSLDEIVHYQHVVYVLFETRRIVAQIDEVTFLPD